MDGAPYQNDAFIDRLRDYHLAAVQAHREHDKPHIPMPTAEPAYAIADGYGAGNFLDGTYLGNGNSNGTDDVIDFGGVSAQGTGRTGRSARRPTTRRRTVPTTSSPRVRPGYRVRLVANLLNGSTLAGLGARRPAAPAWRACPTGCSLARITGCWCRQRLRSRSGT